MSLKLKNYQEELVTKIVDDVSYLINKKREGETKTLKAPTGSGKTYMASAFIQRIIEKTNADICFIWASIGWASIHEQSKNAVNENLGGSAICTLLDSGINSSKECINRNEIIFINWEKLVVTDKSGQPKNILMKYHEKENFVDLIKNTKKKDRKIILIVDEAHIGSKSSRTRIAEFRDKILSPFFTLEMSATPNNKPDYIVDIDDVINEGMIKQNIITNKAFDENTAKENNGKTSEIIILEQGYNKKIELDNEYKKINSKVRPLVLIQIPNKEKGEEKIETVKEFLLKKGVSESNGKLRIWTAEHKLDESDKNDLKEFSSSVQFLIFKTAIATGWDCPRAQILIKFRESDSENFEIQTIGRILRTPEKKAYENELLDTAYIYTNVVNFETRNSEYSPNKIKTLVSNFRLDEDKNSVYTDLNLMSYYKSREGHFNDATREFYGYFEKEFKEFFGITENDFIIEQYQKKIKDKDIKFNSDFSLKIMKEDQIDVSRIDERQNIGKHNIKLKASDVDTQNAFETSIERCFSGLAKVRSKNIIKQEIIKTINSYCLGGEYSPINAYRFFLNNEDIFSDILIRATSKFREYLSKKENNQGTYDLFEIKPECTFSADSYRQHVSNLSLYQPLYVLYRNEDGTEKENLLESHFMNFLDRHSDVVDWFWQNGTAPNKINFGIAYNNGMDTFRPDFIVKFKNGNIGIYDTKPIDHRVDDTKIKAEALYKYLQEQNNDRKNKKLPLLVGGIVVSTFHNFSYDQIFVYNEKEYNDFKTADRKGWKLFEDVIENYKK